MTAKIEQCVVHIGSEKTGTTSIQHYLGRNRELLLKRGVWYPKSLTYEDGRVHRKLSDLARVGKESDLQNVSNEFLSEYEAATKRNARIAVFSSEFLHSTIRKPAGVNRVRKFLAPHFDVIRILYYARRQDNLIASMHSTAVRNGFTFDPSALSVYDKKGHHYFDHLAVCDLWSGQFGRDNLVCRIYERERLLNGDIVDDFGAVAGLPVREHRTRTASNESLSLETMWALLLLNGSQHKGNEELRRTLITMGRERNGKRVPMLTRADAQAFHDRFRASNREFFAKYVDKDLAAGFSDDFSSFPEAIPRIPAEEIQAFVFG